MSLVGQEIDPITLEIYWNRLVTIMDETDRALVRSAFSTIVAEGRDFACILLDADGNSLAQSVLSSTLFTSMLPNTAAALLQRFPRETLVPGDVLITNDPWLGCGHLPDVIIVSPVFNEGALIGFMATAAHMADMGGNLSYFKGRDVFEEGTFIPPMKLMSAGVPNQDLYDIIAANVRVPEMVIGDIKAIVGAEAVGANRLRDFLADYHLQDLRELSRAIGERSEQRMREAIRAIPDGRYEGECGVDGQGIPIRIRMAITVSDDKMSIDYTGTSPQVSHAAINCTLNATRGDLLTSLKCMLVPELPNNSALFRPIDVYVPEGSILNCSFPSPVRGRSVVGAHSHEALFAAMANTIPTQVQANSGTFWGCTTTAYGPDGRGQSAQMLIQGGKGAVSDADGLSTTNFPGNGGITPTEVVENLVGLVMEERSYLVDSAGAGRFRGGLGQRVRFRSTSDLPMNVILRPVNMDNPANGLSGGGDSPVGVILKNNQPTEARTLSLARGDTFELHIPGGGGFWPAHLRPAEEVLRDVLSGLVSEQQARSQYGVAIQDERIVDSETEALRSKIVNTSRERESVHS